MPDPAARGTRPPTCSGCSTQQARAAGPTPLLGLIGQDVAGIVGRAPESVPDGAVVAVEGPVPIEEVHGAHLRTATPLDVASRYGITGVVTAARLSLRMAVAQNEQLGRFVHFRANQP